MKKLLAIFMLCSTPIFASPFTWPDEQEFIDNPQPYSKDMRKSYMMVSAFCEKDVGIIRVYMVIAKDAEIIVNPYTSEDKCAAALATVEGADYAFCSKSCAEPPK